MCTTNGRNYKFLIRPQPTQNICNEALVQCVALWTRHLKETSNGRLGARWPTQ